MFTNYSCSICKTIPDQLSHHNAHLKTQKHKDNCATFSRNMKIFSHLFRQISPLKWDESSEKDYILQKYYKSTNTNNYTTIDVKNWIVEQGFEGDYNYDSWDDKIEKIFEGCSSEEYYAVTGITIPPGFSVDQENPEDINKFINYSNWAIDKIIKSKETVKTKSNKQNVSNKSSLIKFKHILSKHTNINMNLLSSVRKGEIDLYYLADPICESHNNAENIALYESAVKYACLLFEDTGIWHLSIIYDGYSLLDLDEAPEERYGQTFYFHKQVEIKHKSSIEDVSNYGTSYSETKKVWLSCDMDKICDDLYENTNEKQYRYLTNDDFKSIIKDRLCDIYQRRIDNLKFTKLVQDKYIANKKKELLKDIKDIKNIHDKLSVIYKERQHKLDNETSGPEKKTDLEIENSEEHNKLLEFINICAEDRKFTEELNKKHQHYLKEKTTIRDLLLNSKLLEDISKICEFLFEYNDEIIEYYKNNKPEIYKAQEIRSIKIKQISEEFDEY